MKKMGRKSIFKNARSIIVILPLLLALIIISRPNQTYSNKAKQHPAQGTMTVGGKFIPKDVDLEHPVYETSFEDPLSLNDWLLEGGKKMRLDKGNLLLESDKDDAEDQQDANHLVCWLTKEVPGDFLLEFTVRPKNRKEGLNIVFFNARGTNGENIFQPPISPRNGFFKQYTSGDINNYHVSYWAGGTRGTANIRKNTGFHLVATGKDLVLPAPSGAFQTVRIYKKGGNIRLTVDDILSVAYDDNGKDFGPILNNSGWIGLRQMAHTVSCEYGHLRVYPLIP
ncbi:MAG: DUF1961 family protein [Thermodesulfobacteriota bacterium]